MASTIDFDDISSMFLGEITDYDYLSMDEDELYDVFSEYLKKTLATPQVINIFATIKINENSGILEYELKYPVNELIDDYYVQKVLSKGMLIEWLTPQVRSRINIAQIFGTSEQKFFSQANHMEQIRGLLEDTKLDLLKLIRDRDYIYNSYLGDV